MKIYWKYLRIHIKSQLQHKTSFLTLCIGQFLATFTTLLSLIFMFQRFNQVYSFTIDEVLICFAVITLSFSLAECFFRGFDTFAGMIGNGQFDRILVRPQNVILQVLGTEIELSRIGRLLQSVLVFIYVIPSSDIHWSFDKIFTLSLMIICGTLLFAALFLLNAGLSFFILQGLEFINIFTDGGREFAQYPIAIYGEYVLKFLTYIVPIALVQYYPLLYLTNRSDQLFYMFVPLLALFFIIPCYLIWQVGIKHYQSTGS